MTFGLSKESQASLTKQHTLFSFDIFRTFLRDNASENLIFSPLALYLNLCSIESGARGEAFFTLEDKLGQSAIPPEQLFPYFTELNEKLSHPPLSTMFKVSNTLWIKNGIAIRPEYTKTISGMFGSEIKPFSAGAPAKYRQHQSFVAIGNVQFKTRFFYPFEVDKLVDKTFYTADNGTTSLPMMVQEGQYWYLNGNGFQAIALPLSGKKLSLYIFVPDTSFRSFLGKFTAYSWERWLNQFKLKSGIITIPKFSLSTEVSCKDPLKKLGYGSLFNKKTDFTGIIGSGQLTLDTLVQKVDCTFEETRYSAGESATELQLNGSEKPFTFTANKPFIFVVKDNSSGNILIMGLVVNPS